MIVNMNDFDTEEIPVTEQVPIKDADIVLLYNMENHYSAASKFLIKFPLASTCYIFVYILF